MNQISNWLNFREKRVTIICNFIYWLILYYYQHKILKSADGFIIIWSVSRSLSLFLCLSLFRAASLSLSQTHKCRNTHKDKLLRIRTKEVTSVYIIFNILMFPVVHIALSNYKFTSSIISVCCFPRQNGSWISNEVCKASRWQPYSCSGRSCKSKYFSEWKYKSKKSIASGLNTSYLEFLKLNLVLNCEEHNTSTVVVQVAAYWFIFSQNIYVPSHALSRWSTFMNSFGLITQLSWGAVYAFMAIFFFCLFCLIESIPICTVPMHGHLSTYCG